jgi:SAM-dependent methyltransferase
MPAPPSPDPSGPPARFIAHLTASLADGSFVKLLFGRPRGGAAADLHGVSVRRLSLRGEDGLSFVHRHATRDVTANLPLADALALVRDKLLPEFAHAHLVTTRQDVQLAIGKKGRPLLRVGRLAGAPDAARAAPAVQAHDREKHRFLDLSRPFLAELGVTDAEQRLIPAMSRKWKQINKFVEILDHALVSAGLAARSPLRVLDFGSGKGYLTFAVHDYLRNTLGVEARVTGVELRGDLVELCNGAARRLGLAGLAFEQGDVRTHAADAVDVMIALHACDTATDVAIHAGIRAGAGVILCSPCCHKQLRPQMASPRLLQPLLQHGIHMGQEAEMVTDGLRALLLESENYATQVFEFVSLEHTSKNKMILAVHRREPLPAARRAELQRQIAEIKGFYGVREQCLETLLCGPAAAGG